MAAGSKDPLVFCAAGWAAYNTKRFDEAQARFKQAREAVDSSTYSDEIKFMVHDAWQCYIFFIRAFPSFRPYLKAYIARAVPWLIERKCA